MISALDLTALLSKAHGARPDFKRADAQREAKEYAAAAAEREAIWPSFALGALYFPPTIAMPHHGYGATISMSLPWLWGAAASRKDAEREFLRAARSNADAARIPADAEVVAAEAAARSAARRFQVLRNRALPASHRAFDAVRAGFESGRTDLMTMLDARRAVFDIERDIVAARADLDRALTELEAAVATEIPLRPLEDLDFKQSSGGSDEP